MLEKFFEKYPDYQISQMPTAEKIEEYQNMLPKEIISIWRDYGFGNFMDGYLRLIDPAQFQEFTDNYIENIGFNYTPIAVSAFGDLFVWKKKGEGFMEFYDFRHSVFETISTSRGLDLLFDVKFIDDSYIWDKLNASVYHEAKAKLGVPAYDQCYGYVPLLALGGSESVDNIQIVNLQVHMDLMAQVSGPL